MGSECRSGPSPVPSANTGSVIVQSVVSVGVSDGDGDGDGVRVPSPESTQFISEGSRCV